MVEFLATSSGLVRKLLDGLGIRGAGAPIIVRGEIQPSFVANDNSRPVPVLPVQHSYPSTGAVITVVDAAGSPTEKTQTIYNDTLVHNPVGSDTEGTLHTGVTGKQYFLRSLQASKGSAGAQRMQILDGSGGTVLFTFIINQSSVSNAAPMTFDPPLKLTTGNSAIVKIATANPDMYISLQGWDQ